MSKSSNLPARLTRAVLGPADLITAERLSPGAWVAIALILIATVALAEPHVRHLVFVYVLERPCLSSDLKELGKEYCDFAIVLSQVLLACVVGGIVITDNIVAAAQEYTRRLEYAIGRSQAEENRQLRRRLYRAFDKARKCFRNITIWNCLSKAYTLLDAVFEMYHISRSRLPRFYAGLIVFRFLAAFPKGLYGVVALIVFDALLLSQVVKTYYEYAHTC